MIILLYLFVIVGWALLILIIKCRKAREKRIAMAQQEAQAQSIHVIQIGNNLYDVIPIHHTHNCRRFRHADSSGSLHNTHTNPTFIMDEGVYPNNSLILEPPPSYEEVIRLPNQYPKLNSRTATPLSNNPPPTISELEASAPSITSITSSSPAVISGSNTIVVNNNPVNNVAGVPVTAQSTTLVTNSNS